ncbi:hypothetical protein B0T14DRAFT_562919 [Immersiella caudata]|uniref:Fungal-type protein kinase domain-containing protein n=1 Tax=Immersiella caudata TaxID=314043 RepID=A0AA39X4C2_9PEZI|nr:hypothetical protein B0T14DRAFT_562919 [Immersiella caudata]
MAADSNSRGPFCNTPSALSGHCCHFVTPLAINEDGLRFVSTVLGFLWMNEEELGFDPTFTTANGQRFIEIERNGSKERLIIDEPQIPLVIKDSWQYPKRGEEGELLREVTGKGVINIARHYYDETVQIHADEFYALRASTKPRRPEEPPHIDPERAVELLEDVLGL